MQALWHLRCVECVWVWSGALGSRLSRRAAHLALDQGAEVVNGAVIRWRAGREYRSAHERVIDPDMSATSGRDQETAAFKVATVFSHLASWHGVSSLAGGRGLTPVGRNTLLTVRNAKERLAPCASSSTYRAMPGVAKTVTVRRHTFQDNPNGSGLPVSWDTLPTLGVVALCQSAKMRVRRITASR